MKIGLIDTAALCHAAKYTMRNLSIDEQETGVIFGFMRYLLSLQKQFNFNNLFFCFDSKKSDRKKLFKDYKLARKQKSPEDIALNKIAYPQFDILQHEVLPAIGFKNIFHTEGLESDDTIASIVFNKNPDDQIVIVSRDADLWQLLIDGQVNMYDFVSKKILTAKLFSEKWGISPKRWGKVKAIGGCKSDSVPGIAGVGEKTVCKYLRGELKETTKAYQKIVSDEGRAIAARNAPLVILPFKNTPLYETNLDELNFGALKEVFITYQFKSQLYSNVLQEWRSAFNWK